MSLICGPENRFCVEIAGAFLQKLEDADVSKLSNSHVHTERTNKQHIFGTNVNVNWGHFTVLYSVLIILCVLLYACRPGENIEKPPFAIRAQCR